MAPRNLVHRSALLVAAALVALPLALGAVALACTPLPRSFGLIPKSASGAAVARAVGEGVAPHSPVEVRWEDVKGDLIGTAVADEKGQFSALVAIPPAPPGAHAVLFRARGVGAARLTTVGRLPFAVTAPGELEQSATSAGRWRVRMAESEPASGRAPATGTVVMVVGMVALSAGAGAAVVGRRRARAGSTV